VSEDMNSIRKEEQISLIKTSKLAITSLVFGILSPIIVCSLISSNVGLDTTPPFTILETTIIILLIVANILSILALVLGIITVKKIDKSSNLKGRAFAITGLVFGSLFLLVEVLFIIGLFYTTRHM
jgi:hypothetical protein